MGCGLSKTNADGVGYRNPAWEEQERNKNKEAHVSGVVAGLQLRGDEELKLPAPPRFPGSPELLEVTDKQFPGGKRHVPVLNPTVAGSKLHQRRASGDSTVSSPADGDVLTPRSIDTCSIFSPKSPGGGGPARDSSSPGGRSPPPSRQNTQSTAADTECGGSPSQQQRRGDDLKKLEAEVQPSNNPTGVDVCTTASSATVAHL